VALGVTIQDQANGSGALATVAGSSGGSVAMWRAPVTASAIGTYVSVTSRTGDGTITVGGTGYYSWYAVEGVTQTSAVYQPITAEGDSVAERCLVMVKDRIEALSLPGLDSGHVYAKALLGDQLDVEYPCVVVSFDSQAETPRGGTNMHDIVAVNIRVDAIDNRVGANGDEFRAQALNWRQRISRAIDHSHWDARVPEVMWAEVQPNQVFELSRENTLARWGVVTVSCVSRLLRGTTVGKSIAA
jgi:hypothetical protein